MASHLGASATACEDRDPAESTGPKRAGPSASLRPWAVLACSLSGSFARRSSPPAAAGASRSGMASCRRAPAGSLAVPLTRGAPALWSLPGQRQPPPGPRSPPEPRRSSSSPPSPRQPRSVDRGRVEVPPAVPPAAPPWHVPCLSASSRGRASRTQVVGLPSMYSLPWLDGRRSIAPPEAARGADVPRASWPRSPSSRTPPVPTMIAATSPIKTARCPDLAHIRRFVELSLDTRRSPRHIPHSVARSNGPTILGPSVGPNDGDTDGRRYD